MSKSFKEKMAKLDFLLAEKKISEKDYAMWRTVYTAEKNQK